MSRVLVVEDSEPLARLLIQTLQRVGHEATWAPSAAAAREQAEAVEVVLLDMHLSDGEGQDVVSDLRAAAPGCRVIGVSGAPPTSDVAARFDAFLLKPVALDAVLAAITPA
ncbi:MAG TPA: response regulator [Acidimicrobiales bacterium]|nr:response regulator [Acidimicrobiales bacterium]